MNNFFWDSGIYYRAGAVVRIYDEEDRERFFVAIQNIWNDTDIEPEPNIGMPPDLHKEHWKEMYSIDRTIQKSG